MIESQTTSPLKVGVLGVRGYVGRELVQLIEAHPVLNLAWVSSRQLAGKPLQDFAAVSTDLIIEDLSAADIQLRNTDIVVLALPNGLAGPYVEALLQRNPQTTSVIIDLSADYRFNSEWHYSVAEIDEFEDIRSAKQLPIKISNPGCYATAMQLVIEPIKNCLAKAPHCFGVSGYSGAGTKPSANNNADKLRDNILAYQLVEHLHEKEVSYQLAHPVNFTPHVAQFFRGIIMTVQLDFSRKLSDGELLKIFENYYAQDTLVTIQSDIPDLQQVVNSHKSVIGGFHLSEQGDRGTIVCCLDNLLKGAASQAIQNINLALGLTQNLGLDTQTKQPTFSHANNTNSIGA